MRKTVKKDSIMMTDIKAIYGAMYKGMQVFCKDGSIWNVQEIKLNRITISGDFTKDKDSPITSNR